MTKKHDKKCPLAPRLRFPEFRDEWYSQALGAIASIIKEKAGNKKCTLMSIMTGVGLISQIDKFGKEIAGNQYKNYIILRNNDFAYNKSATKDYPQGFIALYTGSEIAAVPNSIFTCFKVQQKIIVPAYLNYLFLGNFHGKWLQRYITVGARAHGSLSIDDDDLLSLPIPYPKGVSSLGEQQKIADCLSTLDERIAAETNKFDRLKDHKKGLLKQLFPAEGETLPQLRFPEFGNSGKWQKIALSDICDIITGYTFPECLQGKIHGLYPFCKVSDISKAVSEHGGLLDRALNYVGDDELSILKAKPLPVGTTVFAKIGEALRLNRRAITTVECLIDNNAVGIKAKSKKSTDYFLYTLSQLIDLSEYCGGAVPSVNKTVLENISVVIPTSYEQQRIADCLSSLDELIASQTQKIDLLKDHKKGLMQQLFPRIDEVLA